MHHPGWTMLVRGPCLAARKCVAQRRGLRMRRRAGRGPCRIAVNELGLNRPSPQTAPKPGDAANAVPVVDGGRLMREVLRKPQIRALAEGLGFPEGRVVL